MRRGRFPQACAGEALTRQGAEARGGLWTGAWIGSPGSLWWQNARDASTPTAHVAQGARRLSDFACFSNCVRDILLRDTVRPRSQARRAAKGFFGQRTEEEWNALPPGTVSFCVHKISEADRQTVLPYLKSADVQWLLKKWTGELQTKDACYSLRYGHVALSPSSSWAQEAGIAWFSGIRIVLRLHFSGLQWHVVATFSGKSRQILCQKKCEI